MAKRIDQRSAPITVKLILHRAANCGSGSDRLIEDRVNVLDINHQADGRALQSRWAEGIHFRELIGQHDHGIADPNFGMHDLAAGAIHAHDFSRAECPLVTLQSLRGTGKNQVRRHRMVSIRNWLHGHGISPAGDVGPMNLQVRIKSPRQITETPMQPSMSVFRIRAVLASSFSCPQFSCRTFSFLLHVLVLNQDVRQENCGQENEGRETGEERHWLCMKAARD